MSDKSLPNNPVAEKTLLGMILSDNSIFWDVSDYLHPDYFYNPTYKIIYQTLVDITTSSNQAIFDAVSIADHLKKNGKLVEVGGIPQLSKIISDLQFGLVQNAKVDNHVKILRDNYNERYKIRLVARLNSELLDSDTSAAEATQKELLDLTFSLKDKTISLTSEFSSEVVEETFETGKNQSRVTGARTGIQQLDYITAGLQKDDVIVLAARPSVGKTALGLNIASFGALEEKYTICFFSLEMSREQLLKRLLSSEARVPMQKLKTGLLSLAEWARIINAKNKLDKSNLYIDDNPRATTLHIQSAVQRILAKEGKIDYIVIDYLQLMTGVERAESRQAEVSRISRELKIMAKTLSIPIIALSQLNRESVKNRKVQKPQLSDLRESGSIEQDADTVIFIHRENIEDEAPDELSMTQLIISKQRNGATGTFTIIYNKEIVRFENLFIT